MEKVRQFAVRGGFHYQRLSFPASQVSESEGGTGSGSFLVFCCPTSLDFLFSRCSVSSTGKQPLGQRLGSGSACVGTETNFAHVQTASC